VSEESCSAKQTVQGYDTEVSCHGQTRNMILEGQTKTTSPTRSTAHLLCDDQFQHWLHN